MRRTHGEKQTRFQRQQGINPMRHGSSRRDPRVYVGLDLASDSDEGPRPTRLDDGTRVVVRAGIYRAAHGVILRANGKTVWLVRRPHYLVKLDAERKPVVFSLADLEVEKSSSRETA